MNLQTHIRNDLWLAIQSAYVAGNYCHAILDAMHYLSGLLRDRTGVDGDGASLVGQALGGDSPRLRINRLQTETEKSEQRGIESILRGMYQAIRNPRGHEQIEDTKEDADAIIYFLNFLVGIIHGSKEPFVLSNFIERVFDPDFVVSQQYAELLVDEIPTNKRFDALVALYREKLNGDIYHVGLVVRTLISKLSEDQVKQYLAIVSDELAVVRDEKEIRYNLHLMPPDHWSRLSEISRLRIETRVIRAIKEGQASNGRAMRGGLATWARGHYKHFTLRNQIGAALLEKLESDHSADRHYVVQFLFAQLPDMVLKSSDVQRAVDAISRAIKDEDYTVWIALTECIHLLPVAWEKAFVEALKDLEGEMYPPLYLRDGTQPLKSDESHPSGNEEEIFF